MTQELTTTEIKAKIRLFAWPITLSMLVAQLYSVIDMPFFGCKRTGRSRKCRQRHHGFSGYFRRP